MSDVERSSKPNTITRRSFFGASLATAVVVAGLSLTGCSTSSSSGSSSSSSKASAGTSLKIGVVSLSEADALDPANASTTGGYIFAKQVFDTLTDYGTDGKWFPRLAESITEGSNAAEWTVKLRDAKWHDGSAVKASDVVATVQRWFDLGLPPAESLSYIDPDATMATDDKTVVFKLTKPVVLFPDALCSPLCGIVPEGFDEKNPVGSGPFVYESVTAGVQMTFKSNSDYWGTVPAADELVISSFADTSAEANALTAHQIDVAANFDSTLVSLIQGTSGFDIFSYPTSGALSWAMNCQQEPFDDPVVRQALRLAVNREEIVSNVYGGYATVANDYWSPYDPCYTTSLAQRTYDSEGAKALLTGAGYTLPVHIDLWGCPNQPTSDRQNEILVEQASNAGFEITFHKVDSATFYGDAYGTYPLSLSYWGYLSIFDQASMTITKDAPYNSTHWVDDEYDALYQQAVQTEDETARKALVTQMQTIEYERGSYIVPIFVDTLVAHSTDVTGFEQYPNTDGALGYNFNTLA